MVCDSWRLFIEYSVSESPVGQSSYQRSSKRRRASHDNSSDERIDTLLQSRIALSSDQQEGECRLWSKFLGDRRLHLEGAKACLLSLKGALRKLHRRKLFPYNPEVLIKRYSLLVLILNINAGQFSVYFHDGAVTKCSSLFQP